MNASDGDPSSRRAHVDLHRLPLWLQYVIAIAVAAAVMWLAWTLRATSPGPAWIREFLVPAWVTIGLLVLAGLAVRWLVRRLRR